MTGLKTVSQPITAKAKDPITVTSCLDVTYLKYVTFELFNLSAHLFVYVTAADNMESTQVLYTRDTGGM